MTSFPGNGEQCTPILSTLLMASFNPCYNPMRQNCHPPHHPPYTHRRETEAGEVVNLAKVIQQQGGSARAPGSTLLPLAPLPPAGRWGEVGQGILRCPSGVRRAWDTSLRAGKAPTGKAHGGPSAEMAFEARRPEQVVRGQRRGDSFHRESVASWNLRHAAEGRVRKGQRSGCWFRQVAFVRWPQQSPRGG